VAVRPVRRGDLDQVIALDATVTGLEKQTYWRSVYRRYGAGQHDQKHFLVAVAGRRIVGFLIGEVRDWEFGSPPCGWVFAIDVLRRHAVAAGGVHTVSARRRAQGAHHAVERQHVDPVVLPQPGHDGRPADSAGDGP
jgi:hypothetical protein